MDLSQIRIEHRTNFHVNVYDRAAARLLYDGVFNGATRVPLFQRNNLKVEYNPLPDLWIIERDGKQKMFNSAPEAQAYLNIALQIPEAPKPEAYGQW